MTDYYERDEPVADLRDEFDEATDRGRTTRPETDLSEGNTSRHLTEQYRRGDNPDEPVLLP